MTREMTDKTIETAGLGFPIPSVEMYVPSLARHLTLDPAAERKLLDNASLDIQAWAQAVQWAPGDSRVVTARLERNQRPPVFLRSDLPLPKEIDEQTSVEQALSALTLYRAKLEFLRENAPHDVTKPLFRLDLEAAKVDKQIKSILGDGSVKNASQLSSVSLRDVLKDYVPTKKKAVLALTAGALAACTLKTPEAINPSPTAPVVSELVPTEELEQQMIDSFDLNGQDLKVKISTPDGVREDLPISDIERVITVSDLDDPVYSEVSIAQMRLKDQEAAAIEFWVFSRKDGQAPDSQFVIWTPVGADASGVRLNAVKLAVDDNNIAGVPQSPEIVGNALVPGDPSQPIDITIYKPNQKDQNFHFDLGQALFRSIDSILAWDAQVAEASGDATQINVRPTAVIDAVASQTAAPPETSTSPAPTAEVTATREATTTPEPTEAPRLVEMDRVMMEFDGRQVPFTINTEEGSADIRPTLLKIRDANRIGLNPNLENPEVKFGRLLSACLWVVSKAGYDGVSYQDFLSDSDQYPISLWRAGSFTLSEVNEIRYSLIDWKDPRFIQEGDYPRYSFGFDKQTGVFTFMLSIYPEQPGFSETLAPYRSYMGRGLEQVVGQLADFIPLFVNQRNVSEAEIFSLSDQIKDISGYPKTGTSGPQGESESQYINRIFRTGFWTVDFVTP